MPDIKALTSRDELEAVLAEARQTKKVICIDFWAPWCGPCRMMTPVLEELSDKYKDSIIFVKVDVDKSEPLAQQYRVSAMPTFVILTEDGEKADELVGASKEKLAAMIAKAAQK